MKKVFVSGCFDILHPRHVEFFKQAKELGDYLIVSFASDEALRRFKGRISALPEDHKRYLISSIRVVDEVVMGTNTEDPIFDFKDEFIRLKSDVLISTIDDKHALKKKEFCKLYRAEYIQIGKDLSFKPISTTDIRKRITAEL